MLCLGAAQIDAALARHCRDRNTALLRGFAALHTYAQHRGHEAGEGTVAVKVAERMHLACVHLANMMSGSTSGMLQGRPTQD